MKPFVQEHFQYNNIRLRVDTFEDPLKTIYWLSCGVAALSLKEDDFYDLKECLKHLDIPKKKKRKSIWTILKLVMG